MNDFEKNFPESKVLNFFKKNIIKNEENIKLLISFEEILLIKKNIRKIFDTDNPEQIKTMIGKKIKNINITEKDFEYANIIYESYNDLYEKCKKILEKSK